jgi:hypothetical protein
MLLRYNEFITESLLLESNVIFSDKFRRVLEKMPDDALAKSLLTIENQDLDVACNFIDVKIDNENFVTFTPDRVAQEVLKSGIKSVVYNGGHGGWLTNNLVANRGIFERLGYAPISDAPVFEPRNGEVGELVSKVTSERTNKTWCYVKFQNGQGVYNQTKLKEPTADELNKVVFTKSRQEIRIGRVVRGLLTANKITGFSDSQIEKFVNDFRAILKVMNDVFSNFTIVEGDDLGFWYHRKNYLDPHRGSLGSSCQAVGRLDWLEIYIKNPETVRLLILKSDENPDKIIGRALLWKLDDGTFLMDRIYSMKDSDTKIFSEYAKSKEWFSINNPQDCNKTYIAHIKPVEFDSYPSIDTMNNWDHRTGKISNRSFPGSRYIEWDDDGGEDDDGDYDEDYNEDEDY